jgi:hypothetical protein
MLLVLRNFGTEPRHLIDPSINPLSMCSLSNVLWQPDETKLGNRQMKTNRGSMVAAPFAAIISDRFGRRKGMFAGAAVIIIGAVIATTSKHIAQVRHTLLFLVYGRIEGL